jgi:hypothetical protein
MEIQSVRSGSARHTIRRWTSVRIGEEKNIFPLLGNAELFFNSALTCEVPVLGVFARSLLAEATVPEDGEDSGNNKRGTEAIGIDHPLLSNFVGGGPHISCIREFVGGSDLDYWCVKMQMIAVTTPNR